MLLKFLLGLTIFAVLEISAQNSQTSKMDQFVSNLMQKMTLEEKIGQLNLVTPGGGIVTGAVVSKGVEENIRKGFVGGLFGIYGPDKVRKAQELGFSLNEIRELLILRSDHVPACSHVKELLDQKLTAVEQKITELQSLESSLKRALQKCKRELKTAAAGHEECCPVIDEINRAARSNSQHEN